MKTHLSNAAYGVLDYAAYPVGMLVVAPVILHRLGAAQYGVWMVATAAVSAGSIIASGFGDANIQHVASTRQDGDRSALVRAVRSMMGINLVLGLVMTVLSWMLVPLIARHVAPLDIALQRACLWSLRIASVLMLVRAVESVCISTQRAFERYGLAVRVSILARVLTLTLAALLSCCGGTVISIMISTALLMILGTGVQIIRLKRDLSTESLWPVFDRQAMKALFAFGAFTWIQAVSGVIFGQADRLLLGVSLGATAVASYALCVQMAQPIYGIAASGLHFLFPYISARQSAAPNFALAKVVITAFASNLLVVASGVVMLLFFGRWALHAWVGAAIADNAANILPAIAWSAALLGLNVTGSYTLLALGRVRTVTWLNVAGGAVMLALMTWLLPRQGVRGLIVGRFSYGAITLFMYYPLVRLLLTKPDKQQQMPSDPTICEVA